MVLPGDYTIKLTVGDSVYSSPLKVVHDISNKDFSLEDRKLQFKTAMDLYKAHEQLATVVDTINAKQKWIKDNIDKVTDSTLKRTMRAYNEELEKIRAECLGTKQKSIFAEEKKLRENITDVYSAVSGQEAAPSNMQVQRAANLQQEVKSKEQETNKVVVKYDPLIKEGLKKEGLLPSSGKKGF
jgi:membrane-bound lytic murein transglycosylase